jgi:hypothetical protein
VVDDFAVACADVEPDDFEEVDAFVWWSLAVFATAFAAAEWVCGAP